MAESDVKQPTEPVQEEGNQEEVEEKGVTRLQYLDFVQTLALYVIVYFSTLYEYAKENSGPLKAGVQTVEGTVKTVIGPVYQKFHDVPFELLKFVDRKVDESVHELDCRMPSVLKQASSQVLLAAQKAPEVAREVATEVQRDGLVNAAKNISGTAYIKYEPKAKEIYLKYEPMAEHYAVLAWRSLNQLPLLPQVAQIIVPTAAHWCEKYNEALTCAAERGYMVSHYLPPIPIEKIAKVFEGAEEGPAPPCADEARPVST